MKNDYRVNQMTESESKNENVKMCMKEEQKMNTIEEFVLKKNSSSFLHNSDNDTSSKELREESHEEKKRVWVDKTYCDRKRWAKRTLSKW